MTLDEWMATAAASLDVDLDALVANGVAKAVDGDVGDDGAVAGLRIELLDVARDAAHAVARPAAPLTTFLLGVALGRGMDVAAATKAVRAVLPRPAE